MTGRTIAHYQILEKLGEGGMGVVYKARDTHLDRFVAIKVLPPEKVADPERKRRFVQEAKAASALHHPNIITVHDISQQDGIDYIVMEYVEGKPLDELIGRKGLKLRDTLRYGVQIAAGLARAHEAGITHRDLKPSNIMVDDHGPVKVLDFGLAKLTEPATGEDAPTLTLRPATDEGKIVGTVAYMSPEQAEGLKVDARSDIFSFGSVLYEMVTGRRAFQGESKLSTLSAILHKEPKPLGGETPRDLVKVIERCLRKDREKRFQHIADAKIALEELKEESDSGKFQAPVAGRKRSLVPAAVIVLLVVAAIVAVWVWRSQEAAPVSEAPVVPLPLTTYPGWEGQPAFSPDGNEVVFAWDGAKQDNLDIYRQVIGAGGPLRLTSDPAPESSPAWSPDGKWIAFLRGSGERGDVVLMPPLGGLERRLAAVHEVSGLAFFPPLLCWTPDSRWLVVSDRAAPGKPRSLLRLSVEGGEARELTEPPSGEGDFCPAISPDGRRLAFARFAAGVSVLILPVGQDLSPTGPALAIALRDIDDISGIAWMPDGRDLVFAGAGRKERFSLWRVPADGSARSQRVAFATEASFPAISGVRGSGGIRLVYSRSTSDFNVWRVEMERRGAKAAPRKWIASTWVDGNAQYSPDGKRIAFASTRTGNYEVWICDADGAGERQLTFLGHHSGTPRWSPDGSWIAFDSDAEGQWEVYVVSASGGKPRRMTNHPALDCIPSWSRDGRWIYFCSDRSGRDEVWKMPAAGGNPVQVTKKRGRTGLESFDGKTLFYTKSDGFSQLWEMPVQGGEEQAVLKSVDFRAFFPVRDGIWFIPGPEAGGRTPIQFYSFAGGSVKTVATTDAPTGMGLAASPDGRSVLYTQMDQSGSDLMLVENFR